jgi:hypothetical protein
LLKNQKRIEEELKYGLSNAAVTKADLTEGLRRMKHIGVGYNERMNHIAMLEKEIKDSDLNHLHVSLEADRVHVHGKEEAHKEGSQLAREKRRDIVKNKQEYLEKKAIDTLARGGHLGSALATQSKGVEKLLQRCDNALKDQNILLRSLDLIDSTGNAMASKVKTTQRKLNELYDHLSHQLKEEEEEGGGEGVSRGVGRMIDLEEGNGEDYEGNEEEDDDEANLLVNNNNNHKKQQQQQQQQSLSLNATPLQWFEDELRKERMKLDKNKRTLNGLLHRFAQLEKLCNSGISNLAKCSTYKLKKMKQKQQSKQQEGTEDIQKANFDAPQLEQGAYGYQQSGFDGDDEETVQREHFNSDPTDDNNNTALLQEAVSKLGQSWNERDHGDARTMPHDISHLSHDGTIALIRFLASKLHGFRQVLRELQELKQLPPPSSSSSSSSSSSVFLNGSSNHQISFQVKGGASSSLTASLSQYSSTYSSNKAYHVNINALQKKKKNGDQNDEKEQQEQEQPQPQAESLRRKSSSSFNEIALSGNIMDNHTDNRELLTLPPIPQFTLRK